MSIAMISLSGYIIYFFEPHRAAHAALPLKLKPFRPLPIRFGNALHRFLKETFDIELISSAGKKLKEIASNNKTFSDIWPAEWELLNQ
jgi:hypothetical protein